MTTVATETGERPDPFTVDYFAAALRRSAYLWTDIRAQAFGFVKVFAQNQPSGDELLDLQRIRNLLAAVELVQAEREAAK